LNKDNDRVDKIKPVVGTIALIKGFDK